VKSDAAANWCRHHCPAVAFDGVLGQPLEPRRFFFSRVSGDIRTPPPRINSVAAGADANPDRGSGADASGG
jgi:hypothetical protein